MCNIDVVGSQWASESADGLTHEIAQLSPVEFNQARRFLPASVTSNPGYINFDRTPYLIEILECFDVRSPVREVAVLKAVQTAYSTMLESILMYFAAHVRTAPVMYSNATVEMARARIKRNYLPMFQQSGLDHIFQSSDIGNTRKKGITKEELQWVGGGYMVPKGAQTSHMMTDISILLMLMDEIDRWPDVTDGDPVQLFKDRTTGFTEVRKILMGSTPAIKGSSKIDVQFLRGDQRAYMVRCLKCGNPQDMRFNGTNKETKAHYGLEWDYLDGGTLDIDSVRYHCKNCANPHMEHDKVRLITKDNCFWKPTTAPAEPHIRSYRVQGLISRRAPWYKGVSMWLEAHDVESGRTKNVVALKRFYNNYLAKSFEQQDGKIPFRAASAHRRRFYMKGQIPNAEIERCCESGIMMLVCTVDVHKSNLAVAVWGFTAGMTCWLIDYIRIEDDSEAGCEVIESPAWEQLQDLIDNKTWTAGDGLRYRLNITFIDSGWAPSTVVEFCSQYSAWVYPIAGRVKTAAASAIREFSEFKTQRGTTGFLIDVNYYKDRLAPVLRSHWRIEDGDQPEYTFNAPLDTTDKELTELTREYVKEETAANGVSIRKWIRPHGAPNELWDLMVYAHAAVEVMAWLICTKNFELETVNWPDFWNYCRGGVFFMSE